VKGGNRGGRNPQDVTLMMLALEKRSRNDITFIFCIFVT